jgi:hypothetical protein
MIKRSLIMSNVVSLAAYREMKLQAVVSEPLAASRESTQAPPPRPASKPYDCDEPIAIETIMLTAFLVLTSNMAQLTFVNICQGDAKGPSGKFAGVTTQEEAAEIGTAG